MVDKVGNPFNLWFSTSRSKNILVLYSRFGNGSSIILKCFDYLCILVHKLIYVDRMHLQIMLC